MSGPFSDSEEKRIEQLENLLVYKGISYARMMKMYAEFLLAMISSERIDHQLKRSPELNFVSRCLQDEIRISEGGASHELRQKYRIELIEIGGLVEKNQPALAALTRCAACCFYDEDGWNPDLEEDPTPIPRYLFLLKKFDSNMGMEFLTYASEYLLSA